MNFLAVTPDYYDKIIIKELGFMETLGFGAQMLLLGILAVFSVLGLIWALLSVFKMVFTNAPATEKASPVKEEPVFVPAPAVSSADEEVVAAIAAAIAMAESESNGIKFRVVSFKRK